jgi:hypothetical protein
VVEHREDRLLDLPGVVRAGDEHLARGEAHDDRGLAAAAVVDRIRSHTRSVQHGEVRQEPLELCRAEPQEHVVSEERVPRALADHPHAHAVRLVGACPRIHDEQVALVQVRHDVRPERVEVIGRHR